MGLDALRPIRRRREDSTGLRSAPPRGGGDFSRSYPQRAIRRAAPPCSCLSGPPPPRAPQQPARRRRPRRRRRTQAPPADQPGRASPHRPPANSTSPTTAARGGRRDAGQAAARPARLRCVRGAKRNRRSTIKVGSGVRRNDGIAGSACPNSVIAANAETHPAFDPSSRRPRLRRESPFSTLSGGEPPFSEAGAPKGRGVERQIGARSLRSELEDS